MCVREVLDDHGLRGYPKTSGSRGIHINVRIEPRWTFTEVRRAALALAREVERRTDLATSKWWKEERHGVFVDYNQNARDRTVASAWSVRPMPDARVSTPLEWDEVPDVDPTELTLATVPARLAERGDPSAGIDDVTTRSTPCTSWPTATRPRASATHRGRPTSASRPARASGCNRAGREGLRGASEREGAPGAARQRLRLHRPRRAVAGCRSTTPRTSVTRFPASVRWRSRTRRLVTGRGRDCSGPRRSTASCRSASSAPSWSPSPAPDRAGHVPADRHRAVDRAVGRARRRLLPAAGRHPQASSAPPSGRGGRPRGRDARADELFAVFEDPAARRWPRCACRAARDGRGGPWPDGLDVRLRIGLHRGRPTLTETGYVGIAVHTAARISFAAHGGQIVMSAAVQSALGAAAPRRRHPEEPRRLALSRPARAADDVRGRGPGPRDRLPTAALGGASPRRGTMEVRRATDGDWPASGRSWRIVGRRRDLRLPDLPSPSRARPLDGAPPGRPWSPTTTGTCSAAPRWGPTGRPRFARRHGELHGRPSPAGPGVGRALGNYMIDWATGAGYRHAVQRRGGDQPAAVGLWSPRLPGRRHGAGGLPAPGRQSHRPARHAPAALSFSPVPPARDTDAVSQENVEIVRRFIDAWSAHDREEMLRYLHPDAVFHSAITNVVGETFEGPDQIVAVFDRWEEEWSGDRLGGGRVRRRRRDPRRDPAPGVRHRSHERNPDDPASSADWWSCATGS